MTRPTIYIYRAPDGWRWRLVAANGQIVASGEAYTRRASVVRAVDRLLRSVKGWARVKQA